MLKVAAVNVPVTVRDGDLAWDVNPGDYIIADLNGVVRLPKELAGEVIPLIQKQVEADEKMAEAIKGGMGFSEAAKKFR